MKRFLLCFFCSALPFFFLQGESEVWERVQCIAGPQRVLIGPEVYHAKRFRKGGTKQTGTLLGFHGTYDRLPEWGIYLGLDGYRSSGTMTGRNRVGMHLQSCLTEYEVEGRVGWAFCVPAKRPVQLAPFVGYAHYWAKNDFSRPKELPLTFHEETSQVTTGFVGRMQWSPQLSVGLTFVAKFAVEGSSRITDDPDPDAEEVKIRIGNRQFYTVEIPVTYLFCIQKARLQAYAIPFWRYRNFGFAEDYPVNFSSTQYYIWGARFALAYCF